MYYALWCLQNHDYMAAGRNATSLKDLKEQLLSYISMDSDDRDMKHYSKIPVKELVSMWEFRIDKNTKKFAEDY